MKIDETGVPPAARQGGGSGAPKPQPPTKDTTQQAPADQVTLSAEAREPGKDPGQPRQAALDRRKRLEALRSQIREGAYKPDVRDVALSLIRHDIEAFS